MNTKELIKEVNLKDQNDQVFHMRYYLMTFYKQDLYFNTQVNYGIQLERSVDNGTECMIIPFVSQSKEKVMKLLEDLCKNEVTIIDSEMIVEDIIDSY